MIGAKDNEVAQLSTSAVKAENMAIQLYVVVPRGLDDCLTEPPQENYIEIPPQSKAIATASIEPPPSPPAPAATTPRSSQKKRPPVTHVSARHVVWLAFGNIPQGEQT